MMKITENQMEYVIKNLSLVFNFLFLASSSSFSSFCSIN
jgi:hypothetical protein